MVFMSICKCFSLRQLISTLRFLVVSPQLAEGVFALAGKGRYYRHFHMY